MSGPFPNLFAPLELRHKTLQAGGESVTSTVVLRWNDGTARLKSTLDGTETDSIGDCVAAHLRGSQAGDGAVGTTAEGAK
ncbi:MAG: hypothetical protein OEM32_06150 [Acidimicrobiia bacterium]|nr:hypothetical protein [Acidimicrobiia bacterium]